MRNIICLRVIFVAMALSSAALAATNTIIIDTEGNRWVLTAQGTVLENGKPAGYTANVKELVMIKGAIYHENLTDQWYKWTGAGTYDWREILRPQMLKELNEGAAKLCDEHSARCITGGGSSTGGGTTGSSGPGNGSSGGSSDGGTTGSTTSGSSGSSASGSSGTVSSGTTSSGSSGTGSGQTQGADCSSSASPSGTTVPPAASITDCSGNVWTIYSGQPLMNDNLTGTLSKNVIKLLSYNGNIYAEDSKVWWLWSATNIGWVQEPGNPQTAAAATSSFNAATCGMVNGTAIAGKPKTGLCATGSTASIVSGSGPWTWTCTGTNGGGTAGCLAVTPTGGGGDLAFAQAFVADLKMGVNIEREHWKVLTYNGTPLANSPAYWTYLKGLGITHVRFFIPYGFSGAGTQLGQSDVQDFMQVVTAALNGGLKVILDLADVTQMGDVQAHGADYSSWFKMAAGVVAAQHYDPTQIAIGAANEYAGDTNADWNPIMQGWLGILRSQLPGYILVSAAANWDYYGGSSALNSYAGGTGLLGMSNGSDTFTPLDDLRVIYQFHDYDMQYFGSAAWTAPTAPISAWQAGAGAGRPVIEGEAGTTSQSGPFVPADVISIATGMGKFAPCPWAIRNNTQSAVNVTPTDASLSSDMENAFKQASQIIEGSSYYNSGVRR